MVVDGAIAWPFATGGRMAEQYEWLTDGMAPTYGMELTHRLRQDPRVKLSFDGLESAANRRWMETLLANHRAGRWHVPLVCDSTYTTHATSASSDFVPVTTAQRRFASGGYAMLQIPGQPRRAEVVRIASVDPAGLILADLLAADWPAGSGVVPTVRARLDAMPQLGRFTSDDAPYSVTFQAADPLELLPDFGGAEYRDLPVFEQPTFWTADPTYTPERKAAAIDDGIGPVMLYDQAGMTLPRIGVEVTAVGAAQIAAHRSFVAALAGRHHPIWVPSFGQDLALVAVNSPTSIDVEWSGLSEWPLRPNRRDIRIGRFGGAPVYRRITSAIAVSGSVERLALDAALLGGFSAGDVADISFMALCRQDADVNSLRLWRSGVVQSQLTFEGCQHAL